LEILFQQKLIAIQFWGVIKHLFRLPLGILIVAATDEVMDSIDTGTRKVLIYKYSDLEDEVSQVNR
jgi:hypothetical protein